MPKGQKKHAQFNTSTDPRPINNFIRGKTGIVEMAGYQHNGIAAVKHQSAANWNHHCLEGAPEGTYENLDNRFRPEAPIDEDLMDEVVLRIMEDFKTIRDVVVINNDGDGTTTTGRLVAVFEGKYFPKEEGCAREARIAKTQKDINEGFVTASLIPDCLVRKLCRAFDAAGYEYVLGPAEGEASVVAQYRYGIFDFCIMSSEDVDERALMLYH